MPVPNPTPDNFSLGIDNRSEPTSLASAETGRSLRDAVNVDIDRRGMIRRRKGRRLIQALTRPHSLWSCPQIDYALLAASGELHLLRDGVITSLGVVVDGARVAYAEMDGVVYWTDGVRTGKVADDAALDWGVLAPASPQVAPYANGGLQPGEYAVTLTHITTDGEESGARSSGIVILSAQGGIEVSGLAALPAGWAYRIYLSHTDGVDVYEYADIPAGASSFILSHPPQGDILRTQFAEPPPAGEHLAAYHGRLYIAAGNVLWHTSDESPNYLRPMIDYRQFAEPITMLTAREDGLFVGTAKRTYALNGNDATEFRQMLAHPKGAVYGAYAHVPPEFFGGAEFGQIGYAPAWRDTTGVLCVGRGGGQVQQIARDRIAVGQYQSGAMAWREQNGAQQLLNLLWAPAGNEQTGFADQWTATVRRNGITQ